MHLIIHCYLRHFNLSDYLPNPNRKADFDQMMTAASFDIQLNGNPHDDAEISSAIDVLKHEANSLFQGAPWWI